MKVIGPDDRAPTPAELDNMVGRVDQAMCDGALGFSTGLFYAPQTFAKRDEVVALARASVVEGGVYDRHIRDYSGYAIRLHSAIDVALGACRVSKIPIHLEHTTFLDVTVHLSSPKHTP